MSYFHIVQSSNFDDDAYVESFVSPLQCKLTKEQANTIARVLNNASSLAGPDYYKVVPEDYKLHEGFKP